MASSLSPYRGPVALGASRYAIPKLFGSSPAASASAKNNLLATKEQIAATAKANASSATDMAPYNADAELAKAQHAALKKEVDQHAASFHKSVSTAMVSTRQILHLIRDAVKKESGEAALGPVEQMWEELEALFAAANDAEAALPKFMEKQKENMSLYHSSMMNETIKDTQEELNLQHKKVNIQ
jgi:hypothetical protein